MEPDDIASVLAVQKDSPELAQWTVRDYERVARGEMAGWVAEDEDRVTGFIVARQMADEIEILNIAVAPDARRRNIGTELLRVAFEWGRTNHAIKAFLETRASNRAAIAFYEHHGFSAIGRRPKYYVSPPEDAIVLSTKLD
jgi:[ribosomal protein S18]-alanine N-acetyltransferase